MKIVYNEIELAKIVAEHTAANYPLEGRAVVETRLVAIPKIGLGTHYDFFCEATILEEDNES